MVENVKLKVIESHREILDIIDKNIGTLVNFDWHSGFPMYPGNIFDVDAYCNIPLKNDAWLENNWVPILVSRGYICKYIFMYPHDCGKDDIKRFKAKKGDCEVYSIKFQNRTKIPYRFITINADFFGTRIPFNWSPADRMELFIDVFESLTARNITMIISKSKHYVNYNIDEFLECIIDEMSNMAHIDSIP